MYAIAQGDGRLRILIIATGSAAVINLVLNLLLIPRYGMNGAAVATCIGYGVMVVLHGTAALQIGYNPFRDLRLKRIGVTAAVAAPLIFGLALIVDGAIVSLLIIPQLASSSTLYLPYGRVLSNRRRPLRFLIKLRALSPVGLRK